MIAQLKKMFCPKPKRPVLKALVFNMQVIFARKGEEKDYPTLTYFTLPDVIMEGFDSKCLTVIIEKGNFDITPPNLYVYGAMMKIVAFNEGEGYKLSPATAFNQPICFSPENAYPKDRPDPYGIVELRNMSPITRTLSYIPSDATGYKFRPGTMARSVSLSWSDRAYISCKVAVGKGTDGCSFFRIDELEFPTITVNTVGW